VISFGTREFDPSHLPSVSENEIHAFQSWKEQNSTLPLALEIGPGVGMHPIKFARENPTKCLVAVEHTREKYEKFNRRFLNHNSPSNLLPVHANAISWAHHILPKKSLNECFILYPNPSPKKSDLSKRWHAMPFMERLLEILAPNATLTLATNMAFYEKEACDWLSLYWGLELEDRQELTQRNWQMSQHRTHFERKYLQRGEICYNLIFKKR
jgi:tRNA G46 methylase TrmB